MLRTLSIVLALLLAAPVVVGSHEGQPPEDGEGPPGNANGHRDREAPPEDEETDPEADPGSGSGGLDLPVTEPYCKYYEFTGTFPTPRVSVNPVLGWMQVYPSCITALIDGPLGG